MIVLTNQYDAVLAPSGRQIGLIVAASKIRLAMIIRAENKRSGMSANGPGGQPDEWIRADVALVTSCAVL